MMNLKTLQLASKIYIYLVFILAFAGKASAQQYLEFVENKGQWDNNIQFKGQLQTGSFALKPDGGYRITLLNHDDLRAVGEFMHGHKHTEQTSNGNGNGGGGDKEQAVFSSKAAPTTNNDFTIHGHVYEVKFLNGNPNPIAVPDKIQSSYNNYFIGNDKNKWAGGCKIYAAVTYKNIYPNVDVHYYTDKGQLKYDIIVNPGGDINRVALYVEGVDALKLKDEQLVFKTSVDEVKEAIPYSYQSGLKGKKVVVCRFDVKGNIIRYKIDEPLDKTAILVIDPSLIFSTFTGSAAENWGYTATYDGSGNFYAGGIVFAPGSTPFSNGAFAFQGGNTATGEPSGFDMGIIKFNPTGSAKLYATYLGGAAGNDYPQSLIVDGSDNLVIAGKSTASDYPGSTRAAGRSDYDIVLSKFKADGTALIGSIMIGGDANDGVNIQNKYSGSPNPASFSTRRNYGDDSRSEVIIDGSGNLLLASCTQSTNFPTVNAFQTANGGTNASSRSQDGVFLKVSANLSTVLVSSYLGGNDDDAAFVLAINPINSNIYIAGATVSTNYPGDKTGVMGTSYAGGECDGFVTILNPTGTQVLKSSYFGTNGADVIYGIQFDKYGFPYIMGTTTGNWTITTNVAFSQTGGKQFISKLQPDLSAYVYSTVFGTNSGNPNISPTAFLVDRCENIYVSGWGGKANTLLNYRNAGTNGLTTTSDAVKKTGDGSDFYFFVLARDATSQLYGSLFGQNGGYGEHVDGGTSRFDKNGIIYQSLCSCGDADPGQGNAFPISAGAFAGSRGGAAFCNLAAIKIAFNLAGVGAGVQSSIKGTANRKMGCVFTEVEFTDTLALGKKYVWDFGDGSPQQTTTVPTNKHTYTIVGSYSIRLVAIDSSTCNISDTSYVTIGVRNDAATMGLIISKLPPCTALTYQFENTSVAPLGKPFASNSFNLFFGDGAQQTVGVGTFQHTYASVGTYNTGLILTDTNYCNYPDSVNIELRIAANVKAQFATPAKGCAPYTAVITNTSLAGQDFTWDFGDGTTYFGANPPPHLYSSIGAYTITLNVVDTNTCNKTDNTSFTLTVNAKPTSAYTYNPQPPQANTAVIFTNNSIGGSNYKWNYGDDDSLVTTNINALVTHIYNATNTYNACLIVSNASGCSDTACKPIQAITIPLLDVPNAITPNGDGVNDKVMVRGYGIIKMNWRIYNRWGVMVFTSNDQKIGWDGKYKGSVQAQDVYTYTLEVEFSDGMKYSKKGDITLLR